MRGLRPITNARTFAALLPAWAVAVAIAACGSSHDGTSGGSRHNATKAVTRTTARTDAHVSTTTGPHPDLGPFSGYEWNIDVHSVHADWTVPHITAPSPAGQAAAWVGAEAPGAAGRAPFVQAGVHEGDAHGPPTAPPDFYYAFYSTTKRHFRPVPLFVVAPGDVVSATLRRTGRRWRIEVEDLTTAHARTLFSNEGAGRTFNEAQVDQEDVTDSRTGKPYPYPSLSALRFSRVSVNGTAPAGARQDSSWLTEASGYLAPGPLRHRAFALGHVTMTTAAYRYLREIAPQDEATTGQIAAIEQWVAGGRTAPAHTAARRLAHVLRRTVVRLRAAGWPPHARQPIRALCTDARRLVSLLARFAAVSRVERVLWAERFYSLIATLGNQGRAARGALGLPSAAALPVR